MNALIHMQPLNTKREPIYSRKFAGSIPRDGELHRISGAWELNPKAEMPHFVRVWADDRSKDFEVDGTAPAHLRHLNSITFYQDLRVLPRAA